MTPQDMGPGASPARLRALRDVLQRLAPRQRQYAFLAALLAGGVGVLWVIFAATGSGIPPDAARTRSGDAARITNVGILPPGGQVNPVDQWVGTAGRKLAQYESEREEQGRVNKDRQSFEARTMQRFSELEQRLTSAQQAAASLPTPTPTPAPAAAPAPAAPAAPTAPTSMPPAASLPVSPPTAPGAGGVMPAGTPPALQLAAPPTPVISRVTLSDRPRAAVNGGGADVVRGEAGESPNAGAKSVATFLPVSFTRGTLLGGLDAPTGGQAQSNPHPVLIQLADNSVLPNRFRGEYRDCFVIAAGYGDISSERAYLRTETLSCVRADGTPLEVKLQGSVFGEDGKVGMRGRLVSKQGQMLAHALLAGVVSGIGQGLSTASTSYSTSPLGTIASADSSADAYRAGLGSGVGKALDRLAQYYIRLAENTFPVIEVDAGRQIDVVITRGVRIDVPMTAAAERGARHTSSPETRYLEATDDGAY